MFYVCARVCVCMFIPRENTNGGNYDALALMELDRVKEGLEEVWQAS